MDEGKNAQIQYHGNGPGNMPFILMAALVSCFVMFLFLNPGAWQYLIGLMYVVYPFLDSYALLASADAHMLGLDVFALNPLDPIERPHVYPRWWLLMGGMGLTREHIFAVGLTVDVLFLASAILVLRPYSWWDAIVGGMAICSSAVLLGVERANNDLIIFALLSIVPLLLNWRLRFGVPAVWLVLFLATGLKYFPAMGYLVFFKKIKEIRTLWWIIFSALAATTAYIFYYLEDLVILKNIIPPARQLAPTIGGWLFFYYIGLSIEASKMLTWLCLAAILTGGFLLAIKSKITLPQIDSRCEYSFLMGTGIIVFCFFITVNYDYRCVFLLFGLPYLLKLSISPEASISLRRASGTVLLLILALLWSEGIHNSYTLAMIKTGTRIDPSDYIKFYIFKHALSWFVITSLIFFSFMMLKPEVMRLWPELLEFLKIRRTLANN